ATQSLRGLRGSGAMHWRGDRNGGPRKSFDETLAFDNFRPTFQTLLGLEREFPQESMVALRDFVFALRYPPNPNRALDGSLTELEAAGRDIFESPGFRDGLGGDGNSCSQCHEGERGTSGRGVFVGPQSLKVPHLRNLYDKVGSFGTAVPRIASPAPLRVEETPTPHLGEQVRGFGFTHDASVPTLIDFLLDPSERFHFPDKPGRSGLQKVRELEAFLLVHPSDFAPVVGQQVTIHADLSASALSRWSLFEDRAKSGDGDLVVSGILDESETSFLFLRTEGRYQSERSRMNFTRDELTKRLEDSNGVLTATVVPRGSGRRFALDRDEDGAFDGDETDAGKDPSDPTSHPAPSVIRSDCNSDGRVDISDAIRGLTQLFLGGGDDVCLTECDATGDNRFDISDSIFTLNFLFRGGPSPRDFPNCVHGVRACSGSCKFLLRREVR
ncbi:MAG: hypothetical protein AAF517_06860, partial [Planctomycetota bacterium]